MEEKLNADLHNHTTGSDGTQTPLQMLLRARRRERFIVSISDHDSVKGYTQLKVDIANKLRQLEELEKRCESKRAKIGATRLLRVLENIKIIPAAELITSYNGSIIEVLGYGADPDVLEEQIKKIHEGLPSSAKVLLDGTKRSIDENNLEFDWFVIENRADFKKLFYHELIKHPENKELFEKIPGETEEEKAKEFSRTYLENKNSPFYVDMNPTEERGAKQIRADFLKMLERNKEKITFDSGVIENSHSIAGEFYNELIKHPENLHLLSKDVDSLKKFIYGELYNKDSKFFIDMTATRPTLEATIEAIHNAGGKAFLAHPGRYEKLFDIKEEIKKGDILKGLDGIEVFYPIHSPEMIEFLLNSCRENNLLVSGGSDDHLAPKDGKEYKMGTVNIPDIPETQWIREYIRSGKDYINEAREFNSLIDRLRRLRGLKDKKSEELQEIESQESSKGESKSNEDNQKTQGDI